MKKMEIVALSTLLVSTVIFSGGVSAFAADSTYSTPGHVTLMENDEPTDPVDPTDPTKPIVAPEKEGGKETGNKGPLSLDVAPKSFDFGTQKMYRSTHTYKSVNTADATAGIINQYLQVTDNRDADTFGWTITVKQDRYLTDDVKKNTLTGSIINIPAGEAHNNLAVDPTAVDAKLKTSAVAIDLTEQRVFEAPESVKAGKGTSTSLWSATDVSLMIPANVATAGDYTNHIVWTLNTEVEK